MTSSALTTAERQQRLVAWNNTQAEFPDLCVHQLFEQQVAALPNAIALIDGAEQVTYAQLNQRANQLAEQLHALGLHPDDLVGICVERSSHLFIGLLAIFKAGGAYVPLDAGYPPERITYMLQDSAARLLLTTKSMWQQLALPATATAQCQVLYVEEMNQQTPPLSDWPLPGSPLPSTGSGSSEPGSGVAPHNLAYCIYTSGSTGNPKGALMEHRSLVNMLWWHKQTRPAVVGVKTLQFCAVSFDFSFHEIFGTLCLGGTLVLVDEETRRNPFALATFIQQQQIEKLYLPVTALRQLAEATQEGVVLSHLREVITTGELLQITPAIAHLCRQSGAMLHNHYGATEFQDATTLTLQGDPATWPTVAPVGRPLANVQVYILDEQQQPVPIGTEGEFCIGGVGVARGYLNRPDLTQAKFIPNPFGPGRLYRTGDLARYRPDGVIEHLGRMDQQVKIRGFRVELGEIEALLLKHPAVRECAVAALDDPNGNKQLVGYLIAADDQGVQLDEALWRYLGNHLPDYMLPTRFVHLNAMPLTPSGKLDRRALPAPVWTRPALGTALLLPQSTSEQQLTQLWRELLQMDVIGIHDSFFALGGTSLLLTQLHKRISETFTLDLPTVALFQYPTIHTLAQQIDTWRQSPRTGGLKTSLQRTATVANTAPLRDSRQNALAQQRARREQQRSQPTQPAVAKVTVINPGKPAPIQPPIELFPSVGEYPVYDGYLYHLMTNDEYRNHHYRAAITQVVAGKTVVDIGTGQDAILARFAAEAGAQKVYALERSHRSYTLAVERIEELGLADRIQVLYGEAAALELPELVDICLSEVIGNIGGSEGVAVILNDARRFLKPNGLMIPMRCITQIAAVTIPDEILHRPQFGEYASHYTQQLFDVVGYPFDVRICLNHLPSTHFLSGAAIAENLDFTTFANPETSVPFALTMTRSGRLDGFLLWINLYTAANEMVDSLARKCNWSPIFLPVFEPGLGVAAGDVIEATCTTRLSENHVNPDYLFEGRVFRQKGTIHTFDYVSHYQKPLFKQTPFYQRLFAQQ